MCVFALACCNPAPKLSGKPVSYWISRLDDLDPKVRWNALETLGRVENATYLEPARTRLHELAKSGSIGSDMAAVILYDKLGDRTLPNPHAVFNPVPPVPNAAELEKQKQTEAELDRFVEEMKEKTKRIDTMRIEYDRKYGSPESK